MPRFDNINSVYAPQEKMSEADILRAIRFGIASEFETIQVYQQIMESTDNQDAITVLADITNEEMHHAGALQKLLEILAPDDAIKYAYGVQKTLEELGQKID